MKNPGKLAAGSTEYQGKLSTGSTENPGKPSACFTDYQSKLLLLRFFKKRNEILTAAYTVLYIF
jgi:hypothetical protein